VLEHPLLYLSLYFKTYRAEYYEALGRVRSDGDWEHWIAYYLHGVAAVAEDATVRARTLRGIFADDHDCIVTHGTRSDVTVRVHDALKQRALLSVTTAAAMTGATAPPVRKAFTLLQELGIVTEVTGKKRDKIYRYMRYTDVLNAEATL
jgi:Fic family protein